MTGERLRQVAPPLARQDGPPQGLSPDKLDLSVLSDSRDRWEGKVTLEDGRAVPFLVCGEGRNVYVWIEGQAFVFASTATVAAGQGPGQTGVDEVLCHTPGIVIAVNVAPEEVVEAGQDLVVIESMKTEQIIRSPRHGTVQRVPVQEGDRVDRGMRLVVLYPVSEE